MGDRLSAGAQGARNGAAAGRLAAGPHRDNGRRDRSDALRRAEPEVGLCGGGWRRGGPDRRGRTGRAAARSPDRLAGPARRAAGHPPRAGRVLAECAAPALRAAAGGQCGGGPADGARTGGEQAGDRRDDDSRAAPDRVRAGVGAGRTVVPRGAGGGDPGRGDRVPRDGGVGRRRRDPGRRVRHRAAQPADAPPGRRGRRDRTASTPAVAERRHDRRVDDGARYDDPAQRCRPRHHRHASRGRTGVLGSRGGRGVRGVLRRRWPGLRRAGPAAARVAPPGHARARDDSRRARRHLALAVRRRGRQRAPHRADPRHGGRRGEQAGTTRRTGGGDRSAVVSAERRVRPGVPSRRRGDRPLGAGRRLRDGRGRRPRRRTGRTPPVPQLTRPTARRTGTAAGRRGPRSRPRRRTPAGSRSASVRGPRTACAGARTSAGARPTTRG